MELFSGLCILLALSSPVHLQYVKMLQVAVQIYHFIDAVVKPDDPKPVTMAEIESIRDELSEDIHTLETNVLRTLLLQSRFDRLDDAIIQIKSSLKDLENYINASTSTRDSFKSIFVRNYENGETSLIRFLPTLLTYQNPGQQKGALLPLLTEDTRCNLTALATFKTFYYNLMSSGISVDVAYRLFKFNMSKEDALKEWVDTSEDIEVKFQTAVNHCHSLITTYAGQDHSEATSAHALHIQFNAWKTWKRNDVFFTKSYGTHQFVYLEYEDDTVIWQRTDTNDKIAVFYQPYLYESRLPLNAMTNSTERFRSTIDGENDESAAKHVGEAVKNMLNQDGYIIESLVILFDDGGSEEVLDPDSPAVKATIDNVKLSYCYKNGIRCTFDGFETAYGSFKIYVYAHYPNATIQHSVHHIDAANSLANPSVVLFLATIFLTTAITW